MPFQPKICECTTLGCAFKVHLTPLGTYRTGVIYKTAKSYKNHQTECAKKINTDCIKDSMLEGNSGSSSQVFSFFKIDKGYMWRECLENKI